ncbi:YesL family protein [Virgibacillus necropolis]|uniref:DUF624 domain-containing protein n=1 Tax=Virgibacillus necropolis TaxID=163877 RepID=A0A221MGB2_9BACI|nr:DUF624 domain-containing protein [Virgibacillus necropolis]ASN06703.1 hypothetical protein CFK40_17625 [Virgibacillus necropolis]
MSTTGFMAVAYKITDWITKLAFINILWIGFTIMGLFIFGLFPATFAMFFVMSLLIKKEDVPVFKTFWKFYKQEFLKSNFIGMIISIIAIIFYLEINFIADAGNSFLQLFYYPLIVLNLIFYLSVLYLFPTYVHYDLKLGHLFKNSFLIMTMNPMTTFFMLSGSLIIYFVIIYFPAILPFFSGSILSLLIMWAATVAFKKIEQKKVKLDSNNC